MPKFETPEPISVRLDLGVTSEVRIVASDRTDTVVDVRPSDEADESDVKAAQQVRVEYANGQLQITGQKPSSFDFSRKTRSIDVSVELPSGSQVSGKVQLGGLRGTGSFGETRFKTPLGDLLLERTGPLHLDTGSGRVAVGHVAGDADIHTGSGPVSVGQIDGNVLVKNSNGGIDVDGVTGDARLRSANGDISLQRAGADVEVKTANGSIHVGEVVRGSVRLDTANGGLDVGIAQGTAAWLEMHTGFGKFRNQLDDATQPEEADDTVEVRGRTSFGDITIRRS